MQTQRITISLLSALLIFTSCKLQKNNEQTNQNEMLPGLPDTLKMQATESIDIREYVNGYIRSVTQKFVVPAGKTMIVTGKNGLKITVDPSKLVKEDGTAINGKILVRLVELTNSNELFRSNAATMSDGMLLASGGSYFIGLECNGQNLALKQGHALEVSFPVLKEDEMQLFYGERDADENMNWKRTAVLLEPPSEAISFTDSNPYEPNNIPPVLADFDPGKVYKTLEEPVYYYKQRMTLKELVDTLNSKNAKVTLQTISYWPKNLPTNQVLDTHYLTAMYGPRKQYILRSLKAIQADSIAGECEKLKRDSLLRNWKPKSLAGQLQKYYAPSAVQRLGWINCDRFYRSGEQVEMQLELPVTLNKCRVDYFIIFHSFNGLINSRVNVGEEASFVLNSMPAGEKVTLVAFTKKNGIIYHCKEDFVIGKNKKKLTGFKTITENALKTIFSENVKT